MGKEILAIPEQYLAEVINILRRGMHWMDYYGEDITEEVRESLNSWCDEEEDYLKILRGED